MRRGQVAYDLVDEVLEIIDRISIAFASDCGSELSGAEAIGSSDKDSREH
jgi:hypothetical protein